MLTYILFTKKSFRTDIKSICIILLNSGWPFAWFKFCAVFLDMQSFLMPPNYFDDGYLAIFLRQLSRRGLLLFYCSQKLTELDTPISFPLSFVPPLYTQKMLQEKIASEKIIIALSYFCQTRYQENWRLSEVFLSLLLLLLSFLNTPSNLYVVLCRGTYTENRSFIFWWHFSRVWKY